MEKNVGIYVHIPFCKNKCDYCDFYSLKGKENQMDAYLNALKNQITAKAAGAMGYTVDTVYIGGGTPSYFGAARIVEILETIFANYSVAPDAEITMEANPDSFDVECAQMVAKNGVNRVSIGMQSADDSELGAIHRIHSEEQTQKAIENARAAGVQNISLDLIYGLPNQTMASWEKTIETAVAFNPTHLSCYGLKVEEGTPLHAQVMAGLEIPDDDCQADMYMFLVKRLEQAGYKQYEISNFSLPGKQSRHNTRYWKLSPYIGFGPGAHSDFENRRYSISRDLDKYIRENGAESLLTDEEFEISENERAEEYIMLGLRLVDGIDLEVCKDRWKINVAQINKKLETYEREGWCMKGGARWHLTPEGFLLSNQIIGSLLE